MENSSVWTKACGYLAETLPRDVYDRWISVIELNRVGDDSLVLSVANDFYQSWLEENYLSLIHSAVATASGKDLKIEFMVNPDRTTSKPAAEPVPVAAAKQERKASSHSPKTVLPLNPKYSFDHFVVGSSNSFAHAAALAVAQSPAKAYNPLFIYGGVGLGKTHLMQAIGQYIHTRGKAAICYTSCETFTNEYIDALQKHALVQFRKKYRGMDILLIDDIQFLAGKERMQEEFFHTFNTLHENHKQIVLTSDRPASELSGLEPRLVSRFEWGLVTELEMPDVETRIAILRKKEEQLNLQLPDDVIVFMAEHIRSNIRKLEGALIRVASYASLTKKPATMEMVETLLRDTLDQEKHEALTIERVQRAVAEYYDIRLGDMTSKQRPQSIAFPRQVAMYLCRTLTQNSLPSIGNAFGRNHATVLHACKLINDRMKNDSVFRQAVSVLKQRLGQH
ncbi:MAG: chromosomal replication initiator protein DnaA [Lentisphaerota bacterium]